MKLWLWMSHYVAQKDRDNKKIFLINRLWKKFPKPLYYINISVKDGKYIRTDEKLALYAA